jgi:hypothetical protein
MVVVQAGNVCAFPLAIPSEVFPLVLTLRKNVLLTIALDVMKRPALYKRYPEAVGGGHPQHTEDVTEGSGSLADAGASAQQEGGVTRPELHQA